MTLRGVNKFSAVPKKITFDEGEAKERVNSESKVDVESHHHRKFAWGGKNKVRSFKDSMDHASDTMSRIPAPANAQVNKFKHVENSDPGFQYYYR